MGTTVALDNVVEIQTDSVDCSSRATVVSVANTVRSMKVYSTVTNIRSDSTLNEYQYDELNLIQDGSEVYATEFGRLTTNLGSFVGTGFGTYYPYLDGSEFKVDFIPVAGLAGTVVANTLQVGFTTESIVGFGTTEMKHVFIDAKTTTIASSGTPGITTVAIILT